MGIVNITPDSFSDGGLFLDPRRAVDHGLALLEQGAHLLDLGAESTRPGGGVYGSGAAEVSAEEELRRLMPVLEGLRRATGAPLSVDTRKGTVAREALAAGADLINDISLLSDPELGRAAAEAGCPLVLMHSRGDLGQMQSEIAFDDVVAEVSAELADAARRAVDLGVSPQAIVLDPGLGFGKTYRQNLELIAGLPRLAELGYPLLLGASRKSFLGHFMAAGGEVPPPGERLAGSLACAGRATEAGVAVVRVHDVRETVGYLRMRRALDDLQREIAA